MSGKIDWSANEANAVRPGEKSYLPKTKSKAQLKREAANELKREYNRGTKRYDEGGSVSDEDTMSENAKKNIADAEVAKSKAEDAKGQLNLGKKRGFFGSLLSGKYKEYKRNKALQSTFGGMKSAATIEAEKKSAAVGKGIDFDPSELKTGPDMEAHRKANKEQRQLRKSMKREERARQAQEAPKGESFGAWFKKQKEGSTATWTNPKTGEKKSILINRGTKAKSGDSSVSTSTSHRTTGAGQKSFKSAYSAADAASDTAREGRRAVNRSLSSSSSSSSGSSRFLANADKNKRGAAASVFSRSAKSNSSSFGPMSKRMKGTAKFGAGATKETDTERELRRQRRESNTQRNYGRAGRIKPASSYCGGGMTKAYKKGGLVSSRADGIASRGRTKCKIV